MNVVRTMLTAIILMTSFSCGTPCDDIVYGACFRYEGTYADPSDMIVGMSSAHYHWEQQFDTTFDFEDLAEQFGLIVYFEPDELFGYDDLSGYFIWDVEHRSSPEIHIAIRERYSDEDMCYVGYVIGHEVIHFLEYTIGSSNDGHLDPDLWIDGTVAYGMKLNHSIEYRVLRDVEAYCEGTN